MRTPDEIRYMEFQKSPMGGFKQSDVEVFLEEVATQVETIMKQKYELDKKLQQMSASQGIDGVDLSPSSLQNIMISAQRVADEVVDEANKRAEQIIKDSKERANEADIVSKNILVEAESKAKTMNSAADNEAAKIISQAVAKSEAMISEATAKSENMINEATAKSNVINNLLKQTTEQQKLLLDRYKLEIADFKGRMIDTINQELSIVNTLPDAIDFDAERAKQALLTDFSKPFEEKSEPVEQPTSVDEEATFVDYVPDDQTKELEDVDRQESSVAMSEQIDADFKAAIQNVDNVQFSLADEETKAQEELSQQNEMNSNDSESEITSSIVEDNAPQNKEQNGFHFLDDEPETPNNSGDTPVLIFGEEDDDEEETRSFFRRKKK